MRPDKKVYRSSAHGSFMLDREIRGVGRIHMASGLTREAQFRLLNDGITELAADEKGRALLRALRARTLPPRELFAAVKARDYSRLAVGSAAVPLLAAVERWREAHKPPAVAKRTYEVRAELVTHLASVVGPDAPVAALPDALRTLKLTMKGARSFNLDLAYASAFVRDTLGRRHPLYLDVRDIDPKPATAATERRPLAPWEVLALADAFARIWKSKQGSRGDEVLAMALTGMGPAEYWGAWTVLTDRVHVAGKKRVDRDRDVPRLFPCAIYDRDTLARPAITATSFARALNIARVATGIDCAPYDLRRSFGNWMEQAGVLRSRRKQYLGHAIGDVTERYERHEVDAHLAADAALLTTWIAANARQPEAGPKLT